MVVNCGVFPPSSPAEGDHVATSLVMLLSALLPLVPPLPLVLFSSFCIDVRTPIQKLLETMRNQAFSNQIEGILSSGHEAQQAKPGRQRGRWESTHFKHHLSPSSREEGRTSLPSSQEEGEEW